MLDPHTLYDMALDVHAQNVSGVQANFVSICCQLDSASLAASAYLHLSLHNNWVHSLLGFGNCFVNGVRNTTS